MLYLGIDTSNYTTSAALADENGVVVNSRRLLPVATGAAGLRQSDAVFAHVKALPEVMAPVREYIASGGGRVAAVGFSARPRDAEGSYMPCFLVGEAAARTAADAAGVPAFGFSHQAGHLAAARYSAGAEKLYDTAHFAFHISGGTTDLLFVSPDGGIKLIGRSVDLHAGQAVDRVGIMLGLHFPCGPELEALAADTVCQKPKICVNGTDCNLSGLQNITCAMKLRGVSYSEIAAFTLDFIAHTLSAMLDAAYKQYGTAPALFAGGVMSNKRIKNFLAARFDAYFAEPEFSSDNAAGIALLARRACRKV